jgi:aerobic carbon-monoxide dehydrogenase medium subunit
MKIAPFDYHRPTSLAEAAALLAEHDGEAKVIGGGQSLMPMMAMRLSTPAHLVDLSAIAGLDRITVTDGEIEIGALVRQAAAEHSTVIAEHVPLVAAALPWIGHRAIRNRGTVCGSIAHADPAAELPAVALALNATIVCHSVRGDREIAAADFFAGYLSTSIADDELVRAVRFPAASGQVGVDVNEFARRHGDFALAGVACQLSFDAGRIIAAALAWTGVGDTPVRTVDAEALLVGHAPSPALFASAADSVKATLRPPSDGHASAAYRTHIAGVLTTRALAAATANAGITMEVAA